MNHSGLKVFVDSSLFTAFVDRADLNHLKSIAIFETLGRRGCRLFTSSLCIFHAYNRLEKEIGSSIVSNDFLQAILDSQIQKLGFSESELAGVYKFFRDNPATKASLLEAANAYLMQKNGINSIVTFDLWHDLMGTRVAPLVFEASF